MTDAIDAAIPCINRIRLEFKASSTTILIGELAGINRIRLEFKVKDLTVVRTTDILY